LVLARKHPSLGWAAWQVLLICYAKKRFRRLLTRTDDCNMLSIIHDLVLFEETFAAYFVNTEFWLAKTTDVMKNYLVAVGACYLDTILTWVKLINPSV
jgi:hypothetical protein